MDCWTIQFYLKLQKQLQISETYLYDVVGIVFDTTSENMGKDNGIGKCLEEFRQNVHFSHFKKKCTIRGKNIRLRWG